MIQFQFYLVCTLRSHAVCFLWVACILRWLTLVLEGWGVLTIAAVHFFFDFWFLLGTLASISPSPHPVSLCLAIFLSSLQKDSCNSLVTQGCRLLVCLPEMNFSLRIGTWRGRLFRRPTKCVCVCVFACVCVCVNACVCVCICLCLLLGFWSCKKKNGFNQFWC